MLQTARARSGYGTLFATVVLLALAAGRPAAAQTVTDPNLVVETVLASGLSLPTSMAFLGPDDILVLEKETGKVQRVIAGVLQPSPVLDVPVATASERGLLGIAINNESPPKVFLYYTESTVDGGSPLGNRVYRYTWNAGSGTLVSPQLVLDLPATPGPNHDGGVILLDGAGRLFAVIGDLNRNGQNQNIPGGPAPDDTGVILRVNQDGTAAAGNPFTPYCSITTAQTCTSNGDCPGGETCRTQVARYWAYGVRNSFGMAIDPATGALWDTENGPTTFDEINRVNAGMNSGWNQIMGPDSRDAQGVADLFHMPGAGITYSDPEFSWVTTIAPTAILFPVGSDLGAAYDAVALVVDNNLGQLYRLPLDGGRNGFDLAAFAGLSDLVADSTTERNLLRIGSGFNVATDLELGPDGKVYIVSLGNGAIYRLAGAPDALDFFTLPPCRVFDTRDGTPLASGVARTFVVTGACGIPATAKALSANLTVTEGTGGGHVTVFPGNGTLPLVSNLNFSAGQTRANNAILKLATDGAGTLRVQATVVGGGAVDLLLDVNGYFE